MRARRWSLLALLAAGMTSLALAVAPLGTTSSCTASSGGETACWSRRRSLLDSEGASVLVVLAVPVLITLLPLLWPGRRCRLVVAVVLTVATLLALASIGLFLLPTLALAWAAVAAGRRPTEPGHPAARVAQR